MVNKKLVLLASLLPSASVGIFFVVYAYHSDYPSYEIREDGIQLNGIYGTFIPKDSILINDVKLIDLNIDSDYFPRLRTNGIGLPNYYEGWFQLNNGESALLFVTDRSHVVYIPTKNSFAVLLSVRNATSFIHTLERLP